MQHSMEPRLVRFPWRRELARAAMFLAGIVAIVTSMSGSPTALANAGKIMMSGQIISLDGRCLDNRGSGTTHGNPIILSACNGGAEQQWTLPGDKTIRNRGRCLAVRRADVTSMAPVAMYACDGGQAKLWRATSKLTLVNPHSGLCLADFHGDTANGDPVWVSACDDGRAQRWQVPRHAVDPSGQAMPVGNLPGWRLAFSDDFEKNVPIGKFPAAVSRKWTAYPYPWHDTTGHGTYDPGKVVSIANGVMNLYLHTENGVHLVSAPEPVIPGAPGLEGGLLYGRYAVRFRAAAVPGYKTAWLLWPDSEKWADGEIDFPEGNLTGPISAFLHHKGNPQAQDQFHTKASYRQWHTTVVEWTPKAVTFYLDGRFVGRSAVRANIPDTPMHWVLQTETQTTGGAPSNSAAGNVEIDWVVAYARD